MRRTPRERAFLLLAILAGAAPLAAGAIRWAQTGRDLRVLWMAVASVVGVGMLLLGARMIGGPARDALSSPGAAMLVAIFFAASTAMQLGATTPPAIWSVAGVMGLAWAASVGSYERSRARPDRPSTPREHG